MAPVRANPAPNEGYEEFYKQWIATQEQQLQEVKAALESDMKEEELAKLVSAVKEHYRAYYEAKDIAAKKDILQMMSPSWRSPLENAFSWLGGWRPTMVFQLAYAEAGHQLEAELANLLDGIDTPTMAALSSEQLSKITHLQTTTQQKEDELSHRMAILQQEIADDPLAMLAQTEAASEEKSHRDDKRHGEGSETVSAVTDKQQGERSETVSAVKDKLKSLEELLIDADTLRYDTLDRMLSNVLTVYQSAQYLVAAGYLYLCIRRIGKTL